MAQENIKLTKTIYSTKSTEGIVDRSFSEFFKTKDPVNIDRFFSIYGELFYDIPKEGERSHTSVIKQSTDYIKNYIDPRDEQITILNERIVELEEIINTPNDIQEHPFYSNGSLIAHEDHHYSPYYMDRGVKRSVEGGIDGPVFKALKASLGFNDDTDNYSIVLKVPGVVIEGVSEGPILGIEDLRGQTNTLEIEQQLLSDITVKSWRTELSALIKPIENKSIQSEISYIELLKTKIIAEFEREATLESFSWKYYLDATKGFTKEEKNNGERLLSQVNPKLLKSRQTLAVLKRIWDKKEDFPNIKFDEILPFGGPSGNVNPLTEEDTNAYNGWTEGKNLFEGVLVGEEYIVPERLEYDSPESNKLISDKILKVQYRQSFAPGANLKGVNRVTRKKYGGKGKLVILDEELSVNDLRTGRTSYRKGSNKKIIKGRYQFEFIKYIYA